MNILKTALRLAITAGIAWLAYDFGYRDATNEVVRAVKLNVLDGEGAFLLAAPSDDEVA